MSSQESHLPVLLVDDEVRALEGNEAVLNAGGIDNTIRCSDSREVEKLLQESEIGCVLLDLWMPHISGEELLPKLVQNYPEVPVIVVTGLDKLETAVRCMQLGAFDYMVKPVEEGRLVSGVTRAIELRELRRSYSLIEQNLLSGKLRHPEAFVDIVTRNERMLTIFKYVEAIAKTSEPVLVTGETGTGKELIARAIHELSGREGRFVAVNAAGIDDDTFSDTLFGHAKGAYTGAEGRRAGQIEEASGGSLFLDEIGDMHGAVQVKLLRVLQHREYLPLGADLAKRTDARVIAATNTPIDKLKKDGTFRPDLFFRLRTHHIHIPPLRERTEDIPLLVEHFVGTASSRLQKDRPSVPRELYALLANYEFPGNIRELESAIFDAVSSHSEKVLPISSLETSLHLKSSSQRRDVVDSQLDGAPLITVYNRLPTVEEATDFLIAEAMKRTDGNQSMAARLLGISRATLSRRLKRVQE